MGNPERRAEQLNSNAYRAVAAVLVVLGVLAIIAGIMYLTVKGGNLPSFVPGHVKGGSRTGHHTKRGLAGIAAGVVLFALAYLTTRVAPRGVAAQS
jgi:hypothetical protein